MILEFQPDGSAVVRDTQQVWPLDQPEKKENITTTYEGTWKLADAVLELKFPPEAAPPLLRGGRYRISLNQNGLSFSQLDGATILDGPSWLRH
jgi:hypothetical protein